MNITDIAERNCSYTQLSSYFLSNLSSELSEMENVYESRYLAGKIVGSLITIIIAIIAIIGNSAVVFVSFWYEGLRVQPGNLLIVYLSTVDILTATFVMVPSAISVAFDYWPFGDVLCRLNAILNYWFACSSSVNLTVISVERAIAVVYPFKYKTMMTHKNILKFCFLVFAISFPIGLLCGAPNWINYNYSEAVCAMEYTTNPKVFYAFTTGCICCYYIPIIILSICNTIIIITARRASKSVKSLFIRRNNINKSLKETIQNDIHMKKTIKSLLVVVVSFYVSFTPYALGKQVKTMFAMDMPPWLNYLSTIFIFISSAINPFIYGILRKDYRDAFKKLAKTFARKFFKIA